jgi:hypothetical protein
MTNFGVTERKRQEIEQRMQNCNLLENKSKIEGVHWLFNSGVNHV